MTATHRVPPARAAARARRLATVGACAVALCTGTPAGAYEVTINPGAHSLFLVVGNGTMTGGTFKSGGTPGNSNVVNQVTTTLTATTLGTGTVAMTTDSTVTNSYYDNYTYCSVPAQVYLGGFYRTAGSGANATLTVSTPASLTNGTYTLPFSAISWVSGGNGDSTPTVPSGTFAGGTTQTLLSIARNTWFETCLQFNYANTSVVPAGTFTGVATYTLTSP